MTDNRAAKTRATPDDELSEWADRLADAAAPVKAGDTSTDVLRHLAATVREGWAVVQQHSLAPRSQAVLESAGSLLAEIGDLIDKCDERPPLRLVT